jgi:ubiquinone/menaquinone biosynthesis C-methylase UbiE
MSEQVPATSLFVGAALFDKEKYTAVDIQPEMLAIIEQRQKNLGADNICSSAWHRADTKLPSNSIDAVPLWMPITSSPTRKK